MEGLEYKTKRFITESGQLFIFHTLCMCTVYLYCPCGRGIKQTHNVQ